MVSAGTPREPLADPFAILPASGRARLRRVGVADWTSPMLATLTDRHFSDPAWTFERKLDGERCLAFARAGRVALKSRNGNGNVITDAYPEIREALERRADGRLRHPRHEGLRSDKDPREVVRERPAP